MAHELSTNFTQKASGSGLGPQAVALKVNLLSS